MRNLYEASNIIRVIKLRRMRWAGHVARIGELRYVYKILVEKHEGKSHSEDLGIDVRIILEWILRK
jgi:hypothetical protein